MRLVLWSGLLFLVPFALALYLRVYAMGLLLLLVIGASSLYHYHEERRFARLDQAAAWLLILANLALCVLDGFRSPFAWLALLLVAAALLSYRAAQRGGYGTHHSLWHLFSALITIACLLAYGW